MYRLKGFAFKDGQTIAVSTKPILENYEEAHYSLKEAGFEHYLFILEKGEDVNV